MDKIQKALECIRMGSEMSLRYYDRPLLVTISGGKDSAVVLHLVQTAGVPYEVQHSHTTVDAPETVYYVRNIFRELELQGINCTIDYPMYKGERTSIWKLIEIKGPPTRRKRYCCEICKETAGKNRVITLGVRWAEGTNRQNLSLIETYVKTASKKRKTRNNQEEGQMVLSDYIVINNDNDEKRRLIEYCQNQGKIICNPIINWENRDVWECIKENQIKINPLYEKGFQRVGCIGCPIAGKSRWMEFKEYPKYQEMYVNAFGRMLERRKQRGLPICENWKTKYDVFEWWMEDKNIKGQINMELGEEDV